MNDTILKFGYPSTLIKESSKWVVLIRPRQVTIGSLILCCKEEVYGLEQVSKEAYLEFKQITHEINEALHITFSNDKINYMALMMVDKHVHFHVLPRYAKPVLFNKQQYVDKEWPGPPDISCGELFDEENIKSLKNYLTPNWSQIV